MASNNYSSGDETYDSALQRVMKECLPPILTEIADKRPADPIEYLAKGLYEFRVKEDQELNAAEAMDSHKTTKSYLPSKSVTQATNDNKVKQDFYKKGLIVESGTSEPDDFIEEGTVEAFNISNKMVHESCMAVIKQFGDMYDDEDLS